MRGRSLWLAVTLSLLAAAARAQDGGGQAEPPPPPPGGDVAPPPPPPGADSAPPAASAKAADAGKSKAPSKPPKGVGEPAPRLTDVDWLLGKPVKGWTRGSVYLLYFWAPYDAESLRALPHLAELQKQDAAQRLQVILIGIQDKPERVPLEGFVKRRKDALPFVIAEDKLDKTAQAWDALIGLQLHRAVLVDKASRIAWSGGAFNGLDDALAAVLADDKAAVERVVEARKEVTDKLNGLVADLQKTMKQEDLQEQALGIADEIVATDPRLAAPYLINRYMLLLQLARKDDAATWGRKLVSDYLHDSEIGLNELAWYIVDPKGPVKEGDLELAGLAADRANELSGGQDAGILDTLARVRWRQGKKEDALSLQAAAIKMCWSADERLSIQKTLDEYQKPPPKK